MAGNKTIDRIPLYFETFENKDLVPMIGSHEFIRLKTYIQFTKGDGTPLVF